MLAAVTATKTGGIFHMDPIQLNFVHLKLDKKEQTRHCLKKLFTRLCHFLMVLESNSTIELNNDKVSSFNLKLNCILIFGSLTNHFTMTRELQSWQL